MGLFDVFRSRRLAVLAALGFSSGLPLYLTSQTLSAWLYDAGIPLAEIGAFALVGVPYTFKWAWAPFIDRYSPLAFAGLGRRRGWMLLTQAGLAAAIAALGAADPKDAPALVAVLALAVAFLSATQDVVLDAYSTDVLAPEERVAGAAVYVMGYRVAMLAGGMLALSLADHIPWRAVYSAMAALMAVGVMATVLAPEPPAREPPRSLGAAVVEPVSLLWRRAGAVVLLFVAVYKLGDHFVQPVLVPFLRLSGFSNSEIALVTQGCGLAGTVVGGLAAGGLVVRAGLARSLLVFGALQALTNLGYALLATAPSLGVYLAATTLDYTANAMGSAAFVAYLMSLCDKRVSATQFALLNSLSSVGQRIFGFASGQAAAGLGWPWFFAATAAMAVPGLLLVRWAARPRPV